jgi:hypothetical protein
VNPETLLPTAYRRRVTNTKRMSQRDDAFPSFSCSFVGYKKSLKRSCHLMPRMIWLAVSIVEHANTNADFGRLGADLACPQAIARESLEPIPLYTSRTVSAPGHGA